MAWISNTTTTGACGWLAATGGEVRVYDSESGELLATYPFEAGFLNDVVVTPDAVYVTDSFMPQLVVVPLGEDGALPALDEASRCHQR